MSKPPAKTPAKTPINKNEGRKGIDTGKVIKEHVTGDQKPSSNTTKVGQSPTVTKKK